ncbi:N,N-dimethylformamidase beta subunit family domain-containing protein [Limibacillus halophilus]|uniref:N,N-dimethylformamidase n=1 Tax=Limibacillus halophilus TaxID=1579333 RepID=A0A839SQS9_9PROT|nr:N,N-dimethylformamidase beta subunit family domain-containing protein [Limibacillus halophilus]MBB3064309.1 N,N-dimethylformamidase [Limibacillus halophilus]
MLPLTGYADRWSVAPGETLAFKVSSLLEEPYDARLVRVICGDPNPAGPGIREEDLSQIFRQRVSSRPQEVTLGSYGSAKCPDLTSEAAGFSLICTIWPSTPNAGRDQALFGTFDPTLQTGVSLAVNGSGCLTAMLGSNNGSTLTLAMKRPLRRHNWYRVWLSFDRAAGQIVLGQIPLAPNYNCESAVSISKGVSFTPNIGKGQLVRFAAFAGKKASGHYNGKLERPQIFGEPLGEAEIADIGLTTSKFSVAADWDFSRDIGDPWRFSDQGPQGLDGDLKNLPARAMTGSNWTGEFHSWREAPTQYGAIHFHDDDIYDCEWETDFSVTLPTDLRSGVYAMRLSCAGVEEMIPFFVRPPHGERTARLCLLIPTFTYMVYANHARGNTDDRYRQIVRERSARPWTPDEHPEYGLSTYNDHGDGSGICFASRRRPTFTMRSGFVTFSEDFSVSGLRHFPADTHILNWLEQIGQDFDVVTDEDLHAEGLGLIAGYDVVMTATHPEYHSHNTWDAIHGYVSQGGNLMYLGGNGFYWKVATHPEVEGCVEIRRAEGGIRAWAAEPGEYHHSFDGDYGGLWRRNGRPPQKIVGVGFSAQGKFEGSYYRRAPGADDPRTRWIFQGVEDDLIGNFGLFGGGAAGFELDRVDYELGSPEDIVVLASSEKYAEHFILVPEEQLTHITTWPHEPVGRLLRADMSYFEVPKGGKVFSVGSITYCGSLCHNGYDNNIARITENVLRGFLGDGD